MSAVKEAGGDRRQSKRRAALVLSVAIASVAPGMSAFAQGEGTSVAQATARQFDIAPQALDSALIEFSRQSGLQVSAETAVTAGKHTAGVRGQMTPEQALGLLLSGTGVIYRRAGMMLVVEAPQSGGTGATQLDPVQVQGVFPVPSQAMIDNTPPPYAGGQVATGGQLGLLGNRSVMDTPFNQTSYTAKLVQEQQAKTVKEVLVNDPSVRFPSREGNTNADLLQVRGFSVPPQDMSYGGLYGILPLTSVMAELPERIEVLKGPSAMLSGMPPTGAIGGTINLVPKRAPEEGLTQLTADYISAGQVGGHADLARRFGPDRQFGVRFNGAFRAGHTQIDNNTDQRGLALLGLDFRGERVRLSADLGYQYQYTGGLDAAPGLGAGVPLPWAPNARTNQGQPWAYRQYKALFGAIRSELDLTDRITAYAAFGARDNRIDGSYIFSSSINNFNGTASSLPLGAVVYDTSLTGAAGLRGLMDTGPIGHEFAVTASTLRLETGSGLAFGTSFATNIYNPTVIARPDLSTPPANKTATTTLSSWGFADTLSAADKRIQLTVGARLQQITTTNFNGTTGAQTSSYDQSALSPSVAVVIKPWDNVSVYGNWIQGLQQGAIVGPPYANAGEIFPPYKSTQYEAGIKVDWGKLTTTASVFQISQPSILTNVAANTQVLGGEQRNQGLELSVIGEPVTGVRLLGGAMFLNPVLTKTQGGLTDGWIAPLTPQVNINLYGEWDLPFVSGLTLNGRIVYTGSQYIDATWPRRTLPEWTRFDLGARYTFENPGATGKLLIARFNVENVLDTNDWAGGNGAFFLALSTPRTFRLSLTADF